MKKLSFAAVAALFLLAACRPSALAEVCLFPSQGAKNVNIDTHLILTFDGTPTVGSSGFIQVFDAASGELVDQLDLSIPAGPVRDAELIASYRNPAWVLDGWKHDSRVD